MGLAVSVVALLAVCRQVHWSEVSSALRLADLRIVAVAAAIYPLRLVLISIRWGALLRLYGEAPPLLGRLKATSIGYLANNVLPLRSGEVIRGGIVVRAGVPLGAVVTTLVFEKALDLWALAGCALIFGSPYLSREPVLAGSVHIIGLIAGGSLAVYLVFAVASGSAKLPNLLETASFPGAQIVRRLLRVLSETCGLCRRGRLLGTTVSTTAANWGVEAATSFPMAHAMGIPISFAAALFIISVVGLGLTIPSSPGGIGLSQYLVILSLRVQGYDASAAAALSLLGFFVCYMCMNSVGLAFLAADIVARRSARHAGPRHEDASAGKQCRCGD